MKYHTIYLNQNGSRWMNVDDEGKRKKLNILFPETGKIRAYSVEYWEAIGNFSVPVTKIRGKRECLMEFADTIDSGIKKNIWVINNAANRNLKYARK